jgi:acetyl-CoA acetyltransferase
VLCHIKGLEDEKVCPRKAGVEHNFRELSREWIESNGGSVALGHPFGATGARIPDQSH